MRKRGKVGGRGRERGREEERVVVDVGRGEGVVVMYQVRVVSFDS